MTEINLSHLLKNLNIEALNEMQLACISAAKESDKIILQSNTGTGKTLAFLLPILERLEDQPFVTNALIICPTRELALQIDTVWRQMGTGMKVTCCYGGHKREIEENNLAQPPKLIIGTPGRLLDHMRRNNLQLEYVNTLVIDEYDKSLEFGYAEEMAQIMMSLPDLKLKIFTSATKALELPDFADMDNATVLDFIKEDDSDWDKIIYQKLVSAETEKSLNLFRLLCQIGNRKTVVFCNHRDAVERLVEYVKEQGIYAVYYHGAMEQRDREAALSKFRNGSTNFLVTTDLAARGLDIPNIRFVIHYQMPHTEQEFIHRNGRTARMEASGTIISMVTQNELEKDYISVNWENIVLNEDYEIPEKPKWLTLFIPLGRKNKVHKVDVLGFLTKVGLLKQDEVGLIETKDFHTFVAVKRNKANFLIGTVRDARIKGKKVKLEIQK